MNGERRNAHEGLPEGDQRSGGARKTYLVDLDQMVFVRFAGGGARSSGRNDTASDAQISVKPGMPAFLSRGWEVQMRD
jgi:hypothetical protein